MAAVRARVDVSVLVIAVVLAGCVARGGAASVSVSPTDTRVRQARTAAVAFLDRYVTPEGRVVRLDQGGDTVSEGQSYGLLLAQVAQRPDLAARIWRWTTRLARSDGLLSSRTSVDGTVVDPQAATDADLVTAWALQRAGSTSAPPLATALLAHTVVRPGGRPLLAAGPWATGEPATLNPSYWALPAMWSLAGTDPLWKQLAQSSVAVLEQLTNHGRRLPADWVRADGGKLSVAPAPSGAVPQPRYGLDAQRIVVWLAAGCDPQGRRLAATWWPLLRDGDRSTADALSLDGAVLERARSPLPLVAAAAAAAAAGAADDRDRLLDAAAAQDRVHPTYYGSAWVALGRALLQTTLLGSCGQES